jgi:hypothetical protein
LRSGKYLTCQCSIVKGRLSYCPVFLKTQSNSLLAVLRIKEVLMIHVRFLLSSLFVVAVLGYSSSAQVRTFVASTGVDTNPCSRVAPCRTFQTAVNVVGAGGEVVALDSAGFGSNVFITKPVSIIAAPGVYAGITVFSGDGVDINAGSSDVVILRGLTIINQGSNGSGIVFNTGGTLHVEGCVVNGFALNPPSEAGLAFLGAGTLEVADSTFRRNVQGILVQPAAGTASGTIERVIARENTGAGVDVRESSTITVRNTVSSGNTGGFQAFSQTAAAAELNIESCLASNNTVGVSCSAISTGVARVRLSNSTVTNNANFGILTDSSPAVFLSRGNNTVEGNGMDISGPVGSYSAK